jgi:hypothetical protein
MPEEKDDNEPTISLDTVVGREYTWDEALSDFEELIIPQAQNPCQCPPDVKAAKGKGPDGEVEVCVSCEARGAINLVQELSTRC